MVDLLTWDRLTTGDNGTLLVRWRGKEPGRVVQYPSQSSSERLLSHPSTSHSDIHKKEELTNALVFQDCSWDQVLDSMESAKKECEVRAQGSKLRVLPRNRAIVQTLYSLADTIPDQNGLSVVRGGLKTIFEVRSRLPFLRINISDSHSCLKSA